MPETPDPRVPAPVLPSRWIRLESKRTADKSRTGVLFDVATAIRAEDHRSHHSDKCACVAVKAVEAFAAAGYELVSVDDLAAALDDGAGIETFRPTARKLLARIIPGR
jgi:hypothetical protein